MSILLPPSELAARLESHVFSRRFIRGFPDLASPQPEPLLQGRRSFLVAAAAALAGATAAGPAAAQLIFSAPQSESAAPTHASEPPVHNPEPLRLGEIPPDFWMRPRELWLRRHETKELIKVVYWKDGLLLPEGYWQACALLRDVTANRMTSMDPAVLDILRGMTGYYQAWSWPHPVVVTSGFRTLATNNRLSKEGAAKNSMHLYGKATDIYIPGIPQKDVGLLGAYMRQGGVGFYPDRGFTHLDTGKLRSWKGK